MSASKKLKRIRKLHKAFGSAVVRPANKADQAFFLAVGEILKGKESDR